MGKRRRLFLVALLGAALLSLHMWWDALSLRRKECVKARLQSELLQCKGCPKTTDVPLLEPPTAYRDRSAQCRSDHYLVMWGFEGQGVPLLIDRGLTVSH